MGLKLYFADWTKINGTHYKNQTTTKYQIPLKEQNKKNNKININSLLHYQINQYNIVC